MKKHRKSKKEPMIIRCLKQGILRW